MTGSGKLRDDALAQGHSGSVEESHSLLATALEAHAMRLQRWVKLILGLASEPMDFASKMYHKIFELMMT